MFSRIMPQHAVGGMQDHVLTLCRGLAQKNHRVVVITSGRADGAEIENADGVEIYFLRGTKPGRYSPQFAARSAEKFLELHAAQPFDLLHSQSIGAYGIYARGLHRQKNLPLVTSLHGTHFDVLTTSWHTDFALTNPRGMIRFGAVLAQMTFNYATRDAWVIRGSDILIATSDADVWKYKKYYGARTVQIRKVYNGIDADLFAPRDARDLRAQLNIAPDEKMILALARLQKDKGVQNAIEVLARVRAQFPARLVIVGDGDYRAALERLARARGVAAFTHFAGAQTLVECARYFNACDLFVDPTLRTDGYDLTIAEAMACAKPVIVSDVGANSTLIDAATQCDGILIPRGDNDALAREIIRVLRDPELARAMGELGRAKIAAHFSIGAMVDGMEQVYFELAR
ncbi:MAG: glycosyltransferase family 4 protein [Chloroflexi bacterium]|nr:glycosyltransferase family 4 protein [Chloroflexota bacterium]